MSSPSTSVTPSTMQPPATRVIIRRAPPASSSVTTLQRLLRVWPAVMLLLACVAGLTSSHWRAAPGATSIEASHSANPLSSPQPPAASSVPSAHKLSDVAPPKPTQPSSSSAAKSSSSTAKKTSSAGPPAEVVDLSSFPAEAHNHSSLIELPSELVPASWTVLTDLGHIVVTRLRADPLMLLLDGIILPSECARLVKEAETRGFYRSETAYGATEVRTSSSSMMPEGDPLIARIIARASNITNVPAENFEMSALLKYEIKQLFKVHIDSQNNELPGRRLTLFLPLASAENEQGGHTWFPEFNYRFPPVCGRGLLWRNFLPGATKSGKDYDRRLRHGGEPPLAGTKYALNMWIHSEKFVKWHERKPIPGVIW